MRLYIERWLKAPAQMEDGSVVPRTAGTPQGGVVSPCLANLFLHYAFDMWMLREFPDIPFESTRTTLSAIVAVRRRLGHCGAPWRSGLGPPSWYCIRRRRSLSTVRMRTGGETIRSRRSTSSDMSSVRGRRSGVMVGSVSRPCQ